MLPLLRNSGGPILLSPPPHPFFFLFSFFFIFFHSLASLCLLSQEMNVCFGGSGLDLPKSIRRCADVAPFLLPLPLPVREEGGGGRDALVMKTFDRNVSLGPGGFFFSVPDFFYFSGGVRVTKGLCGCRCCQSIQFFHFLCLCVFSRSFRSLLLFFVTNHRSNGTKKNLNCWCYIFLIDDEPLWLCFLKEKKNGRKLPPVLPVPPSTPPPFFFSSVLFFARTPIPVT